jgi:D-glycero-D-manno-heptose 1,7-bisphosphate phosphatase
MNRRDGRAVFLDRDGTIMIDTGYPKTPEDVLLLPGIPEVLRRLRQAGFRLVLISNQSGICRGLVTADQARSVHERLVSALAEHGVTLDGAYYCPHVPEAECECRKPSPGLIHRAARELGLDLTRSFMVGDKLSDVEAGQRAGCRSFLLAGPTDWDRILADILTQAEEHA